MVYFSEIYYDLFFHDTKVEHYVNLLKTTYRFLVQIKQTSVRAPDGELVDIIFFDQHKDVVVEFLLSFSGVRDIRA